MLGVFYARFPPREASFFFLYIRRAGPCNMPRAMVALSKSFFGLPILSKSLAEKRALSARRLFFGGWWEYKLN